MAYPPATLGAGGWTVPRISGGVAHFTPDYSGIQSQDGPERPWLTDVTPAAHQLLRSGASVVGWSLTNNSGASGSMAMDLNSPLGGPALKVTVPNNTGNVDLIASGLGIPNFTASAGKVVMHLYISDELGIKQWRPYVGPSGLGRNMDRTYNLSNNNLFRVNGHHIVDIHPDNATANTLLTTDELDTVRIRVSGQPAGGVFWVGGIYIPEPSAESWVVVTFDDADLSMYNRLFPIMRSRNLKFTLGINWDDVGTNDNLYLTTAQLDEMYAYGADVASHNRANTAYPATNPPTAQPSDSDRLTYCTAYRYCRQQLIARGYTRAMGYHPFVQGAHDGALVDAMRAHGMRLARGANNDLNVEPFRLDLQGIVSQRSLGNSRSLSTAQGWLTQARARSQDVVLMGHVLADTAANSVTWAQADFETLIDTALANGHRVGSMSQWAQARGVVL